MMMATGSHMQVAGELATTWLYPRDGTRRLRHPLVPSAAEAADLLRRGLEAIPADRLWVNPTAD
jgi:5-methyltetrahydropteroyltriglutamate--homocysteine methyltransferase